MIEELNPIKVYSFGENKTDKNDKWYTLKDGVRIPCDEKVIEKLWWQWVIAPDAERADDETYAIFEVKENGLKLRINDRRTN